MILRETDKELIGRKVKDIKNSFIGDITDIDGDRCRVDFGDGDIRWCTKEQAEEYLVGEDSELNEWGTEECEIFSPYAKGHGITASPQDKDLKIRALEIAAHVSSRTGDDPIELAKKIYEWLQDPAKSWELTND